MGPQTGCVIIAPRLIPSDGETGNNSVTSCLPTIHSEQLNWSCYARNAKSPNFHKRFNQERSMPLGMRVFFLEVIMQP